MTDSGELAGLSDEAFRKQFWGRLDNQTFERVDARRNADRTGVWSPDKRLDAMMIEAGVLPAPGVKATDEQLQRAFRLKNAIDKKARAEGAKDLKGQIKLAEEMIADAAFEDVGFNTKAPLEAMTPEERATAFVETSDGLPRDIAGLQAIPPATLAIVNKGLRDAGKPETAANQLEYYATQVEPRIQAKERLEALSPSERSAAKMLVQVRGGDPRDPLQVEAAIKAAREGDERQLRGGRQFDSALEQMRANQNLLQWRRGQGR
jgi:hypothetical protein